MNSLKSHTIYHKRKRRGILLFALLVLVCTAIAITFEPETTLTITEEEKAKVLVFQQEIDALKRAEIENRKPKIYPFNPTLLTDYKGYQLGMSVAEIDRVIRFRESGKWFNSTAEFQRVSQVSDSLLATLSPYFKWPEWMTEKKSQKVSTKKTWKTTEEKQDLNLVSYEILAALDGVTEEAATKIIQYRTKIGGFQVDYQVHSVYDVPKDQKRAVLNHYTVKEKPEVALVNVNTATASDLSTVPLLNYELAKEIVDYRTLREGISLLEELKELEGMTDFKYDIIKLYLHIE